jgi:hypothetical protein
VHKVPVLSEIYNDQMKRLIKLWHILRNSSVVSSQEVWFYSVLLSKEKKKEKKLEDEEEDLDDVQKNVLIFRLVIDLHLLKWESKK